MASPKLEALKYQQLLIDEGLECDIVGAIDYVEVVTNMYHYFTIDLTAPGGSTTHTKNVKRELPRKGIVCNVYPSERCSVSPYDLPMLIFGEAEHGKAVVYDFKRMHYEAFKARPYPDELACVVKHALDDDDPVRAYRLVKRFADKCST